MPRHIGVFMDRDGTMNEEVGYINYLTRFWLYPYTAEAVRLLNQNGMKAVVITNQAGVARGYFKEELLDQVHEKMRDDLKAAGAYVDAVYYCPHHPTAGEPPYRQLCQCRKPQPGMILAAANELDIDLGRSFMVGDRYSDVLLAHNAGIRSIFVLSGYGKGEYEYQRSSWALQPNWVAADLLEAVKIVLEECRAQGWLMNQPGGE
jgi:D-glycero-D-manno-heptose 1,7-bisphosphate phosphatase